MKKKGKDNGRLIKVLPITGGDAKFMASKKMQDISLELSALFHRYQTDKDFILSGDIIIRQSGSMIRLLYQ